MKKGKLALVRLKELKEDDYNTGRKLISTFSSPEEFEQEKFLKLRALEMEIKGMANTFLLVDTVENRAVGYFTINAGIKCAYDKPVFEISHLCIGQGCHPQYLEVFLKMVIDMFSKCSEKLGPMNVTARCRDEKLEIYEKAGFTYLGKTIGKFNRVILYT